MAEVIYNCEWKGKQTSCKRIFSELWTEEGLCFTFNLLNASELYTKGRLKTLFINNQNNYYLNLYLD